VVEAARATQNWRRSPCCWQAGAIDLALPVPLAALSVRQLPQGHRFSGSLQLPRRSRTSCHWPPVQAYSIDDSQTTEIDDALSVQRPGHRHCHRSACTSPRRRTGHRARHAIDQLGRQRLSTVYMPGYKITMLPDDVVQTYTLIKKGATARRCRCTPRLTKPRWLCKATETRAGARANRRQLAPRPARRPSITAEAWLERSTDFTQHQNGTVEPSHADRSCRRWHFLYRLGPTPQSTGAKWYAASPRTSTALTTTSALVGNDGTEPKGHEQVQITIRQRGAPLDLMVAEAMILANSTWGNWMAELGVPGIYRSQASACCPASKCAWAPKLCHTRALAYKSYAWSTSPLRRYTDLVNQWQIIACAKPRQAPLHWPHRSNPKMQNCSPSSRAFDGAYGAYNAYQNGMERFWTLQYLKQHNITELTATTFKEGPGGSWLVRADELPLVFPVLGAQGLTRGARLRVRLGEVDEIALDVSGTVIERLDAAPVVEDDTQDEDEPAAGPIAIALDVNEPEAAPGDNSAS
jgi:exoribonuclease-2